MASLGSLVIELAANTARLQGDLGKAVSMTERAVGKMSTVFKGLGVAGGALGIAGVVSEAISLGDELQKGAQRAGIAAGEFSKLAAAAKQTDVDMSVLSKGIKELQVSLSKAASGSKTDAETFAKLGLNIDSIKAADASKQLGMVADALQRVSDPADRTRLGTELLGKAYLDLVPLLDEGAEGLRKLIDEQTKLGNTFSDKQIKNLADTDDAIKRMKASWSGFATTLTAAVAPALTTVFDLLSGKRRQDLKAQAESIDGLTARLQNHIKHRNELLAQAPTGGSYIQGELKFVNGLIAEVEAKLAKLKERPQEKPAAPVVGTIDDSGLAKAAAIRSKYLYSVTMREFEKSSEWLEDYIKKVDEAAAAVIHFERAIEDGALDAIQQFNRELEQQTARDADEADKRMENAARTFDEMSEYAKRAAQNIQDAFADFLFDPFNNGLKGMLKGFVDTMRRMIAEKASAKILESSGIGKFFDTVIGSIFGGGKAEGGPVAAGKTYLVGERGPELLSMGSSSGHITPNGGIGGPTIVINNNQTYNAPNGVDRAALAQFGAQVSAQTKADLLSAFDRANLPRPSTA